ncbi:signal transduction histidine kinase [Microcella putealis]|uniref:histidine kinase n=2 Tax=Microcella putealis TaxID=337005 RepID=A0A4Q7LXS4_9MICO|nr:signal transduction histidine kinase [Microcella putealis]TQM24064.1 signal transduction histidine kinase [Microcella putealis]
MRSVTLMFDSLAHSILTRGSRLRLLAESAVGALFSLTVAYYGAAETGNLAIGAVLVLLGAGIAFYHLAPVIALAVSSLAMLFVLIAGWSGGTPSGALWLPIYLSIFGTVAYGSVTVQWTGRIAAVALTAGFVAGGISVAAYGLGPLGLIVLLMPALGWFAGELVRSIRNRRALSATVTAVSTERDAALTRADLEAERTRVARDVHDIVAHSLTVVIAQADGARYATTADSPGAADAFGTIAQTARDALADVRTLLTELRHTQEAGPQPGIQNLDALVDSFRDSGLTLTVHEFGDRGGLTDARELALYRIVQESLTNALRHGDGAATLDLDWGDAAVDLLVTNVAAAPAPASADAAVTEVTHGEFPPERGHGIDGMRERAILAGGEFSIREGATFRVRARLPREPREHSHPEPATPDTIDTEVLA